MAHSHVRTVALPLFPGSVLFAVEPPAPVPTPALGPAPGTPGVPTGAAQPPSGKKSSNWCLWVSCGCLVVLLILGIVGLVAYKYLEPKVRDVIEQAEGMQPPAFTSPSEEAATAAALAEVPGTAAVVSHSDDWTSAVINVTAEGIDEPVPVTLKWNASTSTYDASVPAGSDIVPDAASSDESLDKPLVGDGEATQTVGGGEDAVVTKALTMCPDQSWSVGVSRHNEDWTTASVRMGPTPQQLVVEIDFVWDAESKQYTPIDTRALVSD